MHRSIATVSLSGTLRQKLEAIFAAGFDGIELFENDFINFNGSAAELGRITKDLGLSIDLYQPFRDFEAMPEPQFRRSLERAERKFDLMQAMGAPLVLCCSNTSPATIDDPALAAAQLHELAERVMVGGQVPAEINLGGTYEAHVALEAMRHLHLYWSAQAPERKTQRHAVKTRLSVTHGFAGVLGVLGDGDSLDFDNQNSESWIVENVSAGGFGAVVPQLKGDWLRVGALLALQPEGGTNWVLGLVRRVNKLAGQQARVGIETLSKLPLLSRFAVAGVATVTEQGVLMKSADAAETRIVLKPGVFTPGQNLEVAHGGRNHVYLPQALSERGEDYEIARFRELVRES